MELMQIIHSCARLASNNRSAQRKEKIGLPLSHCSRHMDESSLLRKHFAEPVCRLLSNKTGKQISFQQGVSPAFFYLLADNERIGIIFMPNPQNPRLFLRFVKKRGSDTEIHSLTQFMDKLGLI